MRVILEMKIAENAKKIHVKNISQNFMYYMTPAAVSTERIIKLRVV